jgi:hypothetical protein
MRFLTVSVLILQTPQYLCFRLPLNSLQFKTHIPKHTAMDLLRLTLLSLLQANYSFFTFVSSIPIIQTFHNCQTQATNNESFQNASRFLNWTTNCYCLFNFVNNPFNFIEDLFSLCIIIVAGLLNFFINRSTSFILKASFGI